MRGGVHSVQSVQLYSEAECGQPQWTGHWERECQWTTRTEGVTQTWPELCVTITITTGIMTMAQNWIMMISELHRYQGVSYKSDIIVISGEPQHTIPFTVISCQAFQILSRQLFQFLDPTGVQKTLIFVHSFVCSFVHSSIRALLFWSSQPSSFRLRLTSRARREH